MVKASMTLAVCCEFRADTEVTLRRSALSACPRGDPRGTTPPIRNKTLLGHCKAPEGTNTKVASAKGHLRAYPRVLVEDPSRRNMYICYMLYIYITYNIYIYI